jgi:hypothetical protein
MSTQIPQNFVFNTMNIYLHVTVSCVSGLCQNLSALLLYSVLIPAFAAGQFSDIYSSETIQFRHNSSLVTGECNIGPLQVLVSASMSTIIAVNWHV